MAMAASISSIPTELVSEICTWLPRADLKAIRRQLRAWKIPAARQLFKTIYLQPNIVSFTKLQAISQDRALRGYVQYIHYDGRLFNSRLATFGLSDWIQRVAGMNMGNEALHNEFISQFSAEELESAYQNFRHYVFCQKKFAECGNELNSLTDACRQFTGLVGLKFSHNTSDYTRLSNLVPRSALSSLMQQTLTERDRFAGYEERDRHFWNLLQAAALSEKPLRRICGSEFDWTTWIAFANEFESRDIFRSIHQLDIVFNTAPAIVSNEEAATIAGMISRSHDLRSFRLSFGHLPKPDRRLQPRIYLEQILNDNDKWENLRSLSLQAFGTAEIFLRGWLKRHASSLRSLELSNMKFKETFTSGIEEYSSWIQFILFLGQSLSLEHVRFNGTFDTGGIETWVIRDYRDVRFSWNMPAPKPYPEDCLRYRIERFITSDCACPFTACDIDEGSVPGLPWTWDEDRSWAWEGRLLQ